MNFVNLLLLVTIILLFVFYRKSHPSRPSHGLLDDGSGSGSGSMHDAGFGYTGSASGSGSGSGSF